ncbi:hypothetical protein C7212DRAFT_330414, partial [Tuber magnatum]
MARKSLETIRKTRIPKHITKISMTPRKYYGLKVYIKSIIVPGTPAFDCKRLGYGNNKKTYHLWLHNTLEEIGPRFFPSGARGLAWPGDYDQIYKAVHQVVRVLSVGIRRNYKKRELRAIQRDSDSDETEMAQDDKLLEGAAGGDIDAEEDVTVVDEGERHAQWEQEEEKMKEIMTIADQENQVDDVVEEEMDAEPIELEDLLGL